MWQSFKNPITGLFQYALLSSCGRKIGMIHEAFNNGSVKYFVGNKEFKTLAEAKQFLGSNENV